MYKLELDGRFGMVHNFNDDLIPQGYRPTDPTEDNDGTFYGIGVPTDSKEQPVLYKFAPRGSISIIAKLPFCADPQPSPVLLLATDGDFYGTYSCNDTAGIYRITRSGALTILHRFAREERVELQGGLMQSKSGDFFGVAMHSAQKAPACDPQGCGFIFKMDKAGKTTVIHAFGGREDGGNPYGGLMQASDGRIFGTASKGGVIKSQRDNVGDGLIFELDNSGEFKVDYTFSGKQDGGSPWSRLVQGVDGNLYGSNVSGRIFQLKIAPNGPSTAITAPSEALLAPPLPPRFARGTLQNYFPDLSRLAGEQGEVIIQFEVGPDGRVSAPGKVDEKNSAPFPRLAESAQKLVSDLNLYVGPMYKRSLSMSIAFQMYHCKERHPHHSGGMDYNIEVCSLSDGEGADVDNAPDLRSDEF
jgi:hypothetical protein